MIGAMLRGRRCTNLNSLGRGSVYRTRRYISCVCLAELLLIELQIETPEFKILEGLDMEQHEDKSFAEQYTTLKKAIKKLNSNEDMQLFCHTPALEVRDEPSISGLDTNKRRT